MAATATPMCPFGRCPRRRNPRLLLPARLRSTATRSKEAVQRFLYEFMVHVTAAANEYSHQEQRKTVTAEDTLRALGKFGLSEYVEYLSLYLNGYRLLQGDNRPARRDHLLSQVVGTTFARRDHLLSLRVPLLGCPRVAFCRGGRIGTVKANSFVGAESSNCNAPRHFRAK